MTDDEYTKDDDKAEHLPLYGIVDEGGGSGIYWRNAKNDEEAWKVFDQSRYGGSEAKMYKLVRVELKRPEKP
jgi:hypothetical protein